MAGTLNFKFVANDTGLKKGIADAKGNLTGFEKATKTVSANIGKALGAISFVAVVKGLTDAAKAAQEDKISSDLLANSLKNNANATDAQVASVEKSINAMSRQFGIADDQLRPALSKLATMTGDTTKAQDLLKLAMDASAATGKPLETVALALGKAHQGQFMALNKLGIPMLDSVQNAKDLTAASKDLAKKQNEYNAIVAAYGPNSKEAKDAADKMALAQDKVNTITQQGIDWQKDLAKAYKGQAEAAVDPMKQLSVVFQELKETVGAALLPVISKFAEMLMPIVDKLAPTLAKLIEGLAPIFTQLVEALLPLIDQLLPPLVELLTALMPVLLPIIQILTDLLVPIIKIVVAVFKAWLGYFTPIIKGVGILVGALKTGFSGIGSFFKGLINGWIGMVEGFINFFIDGINMIPKAINKIKFKVPDWVPFIGGKTVGFSLPTFGKVKIPRLANGGVVMPRPGGVLANIAEAGKPEAVIPLDRMGNMGGNTYHIHINKASITGQEIVQAIQRYQTGQGRVILNG